MIKTIIDYNTGQLVFIFQKMKFLIFLTLFFYCELKGSLISDILNEIPDEHLQDIQYLFDHIFLQQDGAYTIFGDKPVSAAGSYLIPLWETTLTGYPGKFGKSWETWQKYKHKFPMRKYLIVSERYPSKKNDSVALYVYVIDKRRFIDTINHHLSLFEIVLHTKINPEKFLVDIETGKSTLLVSIHYNQMLFGLLLGYGKHNSSLYQKFKVSRASRILFPEKIKLQSCVDAHPMMNVNPVQFMVNLDDHETKILLKKYKNLRKKISRIYSQGDFLEITFSRLTL